MSPAVADETTIVLDQQTPYVDVPVIVEQESLVHIETTTGTPQNNPSFIDSWIYFLDSANNVLFADDDGNHNAQNVLASKIHQIVQAGQYVIRATSFAFVASQGTQFPTGSYLLTWDGVTTIPTATPSVTPSPEPTVEPTPTSEPTPSATPEPTPTEISPTPTPTLEPTPLPTQEPVTDNSNDVAIFVEVIPETLLTPEPTPIAEPELEIVEQIVEPETIEPPVEEPELSVEQEQQIIDELYIAENTIELEIPTALAEIPGVAELFAATEAIMNVGSDMTQEQREESQSVVVGAIIITQIASMANISVSQSSTRKLNK